MQRMQVVSVRIDYFSQYYLVAMSKSLDKSENKAQIGHTHPKCFHTRENNVKIGPVYPDVAISHSILECQSDKWEEFSIFFHKIGCHGNVDNYRKKRSRQIIGTQNAFIWWDDSKIGPSWDNCSTTIVKEKKKRKEINASKIGLYSPSASLPSRLNKLTIKITRNAWQSLSYSPFGAAVSHPSN